MLKTEEEELVALTLGLVEYFKSKGSSRGGPQGPWEHIWDVHCVWQQREQGWKCRLHQETEPLKSFQEITLPQLFEEVFVDGARSVLAVRDYAGYRGVVVGSTDESQGGVDFFLSHAKEVKTGICVVKGNTLYCKRARAAGGRLSR